MDLEPEILKAMQEGHGGWNPRMAEVFSQIKFIKGLPKQSFTVIIFELELWETHAI